MSLCHVVIILNLLNAGSLAILHISVPNVRKRSRGNCRVVGTRLRCYAGKIQKTSCAQKSAEGLWGAGTKSARTNVTNAVRSLSPLKGLSFMHLVSNFAIKTSKLALTAVVGDVIYPKMRTVEVVISLVKWVAFIPDASENVASIVRRVPSHVPGNVSIRDDAPFRVERPAKDCPAINVARFFLNVAIVAPRSVEKYALPLVFVRFVAAKRLVRQS